VKSEKECLGTLKKQICRSYDEYDPDTKKKPHKIFLDYGMERPETSLASSALSSASLCSASSTLEGGR
jgi:hypothetical protein